LLLLRAAFDAGCIRGERLGAPDQRPYFPDNVRAAEAAVFWFGGVDAEPNYADVRIAFTSTERGSGS
jgi:hypothetical protein